jgi:hypothetical protein
LVVVLNTTKMSETRVPAVNVFAGRLGGNQEFVLDRDDPDNASFLEMVPDAAPMIPLKTMYDLRAFRNPLLWKQAVVEGFGMHPIQPDFVKKA